MVDALREAWRVLKPSGVLLDVRPVTEPLVLEILAGTHAVWSKTVHLYSTPEDIAAADAAMRHARSQAWFAFHSARPFEFEIYCANAEDLRAYIASRELTGEEILFEDLEEQRRKCGSGEASASLRCRRPWMLSTYRKK